jgi:hypothetical protein
MAGAHMALLRAELGVLGRELGIIVGLAAAAAVVAILTLILLYVGSFLFFGQWLFGSMGWGLIHGSLVAIALIGFVGVNLGGGDQRRYGWGLLIGVVTTVVVALLLLSNVGNDTGGWIRDRLTEAFVTEDLPFGEAWLVTISGAVIGGLLLLLVGLVMAWRQGLRGRPLGTVAIASFGAGGFVGAIYLSTRYAAADGVLGLAITIGLLTWIVSGLLLAARAGFDPEARYANLVPKESMAAFQASRDFLSREWTRQKDRMMGR